MGASLQIFLSPGLQFNYSKDCRIRGYMRVKWVVDWVFAVGMARKTSYLIIVRLTSSIHTLPEILLSNLSLAGRATPMSSN